MDMFKDTSETTTLIHFPLLNTTSFAHLVLILMMVSFLAFKISHLYNTFCFSDLRSLIKTKHTCQITFLNKKINIIPLLCTSFYEPAEIIIMHRFMKFLSLWENCSTSVQYCKSAQPALFLMHTPLMTFNTKHSKMPLPQQVSLKIKPKLITYSMKQSTH